MIEPTRQEILRMKLDDLRPIVQAWLRLEDWTGDWAVAGAILEDSFFNFQRADTGEQLFGITLFGHRVTGSGIDENALVAIFRAYILLRMEEEDLTKGRDIL